MRLMLRRGMTGMKTMKMSLISKDLQFTTYTVGMFPHGFITHYPTGITVDWETSKEHPSQYRARQEALEKLEKLINDQAQKNT
jgi:hypothetical protein